MIQPLSQEQQMKEEEEQQEEEEGGQEYVANTGTLDRYFIGNKRTKQL